MRSEKVVFSSRSQNVTFISFSFLFMQDSAQACEAEQGASKAPPKRLRSLDTFRGHVAVTRNSPAYHFISSCAVFTC